jgi:predicted GNAT family acetyltransferase
MFNGRLPDAVQIGGVFTPPALRARGFARAVVAGALLAARADGVTRSILFTGRDNAFARSAYLSLGYGIVGDYGIVFLADPLIRP